MGKEFEIFEKIEAASDDVVWSVYAFAITLLKKRGLIRTKNITGERGEFLAIETYNKIPGLPKLQAAPEGTQNVDALSRKGDRYSIKTITEPNSLTSVFYGLGDPEIEHPSEKKFEYVVIVLIDQNLQPKKILEITWEQFFRLKKWHKTMRGWNITVTKALVAEARIIYPRVEEHG